MYVFKISAACVMSARIQKDTRSTNSYSFYNPSIQVECKTDMMLIMIENNPKEGHTNNLFSGMVYPKGLPKHSTCLSEYRNHEGPLRYTLPLRSCNTMPQESDSGEIEFFNTIVVQPHLKLVTDLGRGFHVRCTYKNREAINLNNIHPHNFSADNITSVKNPEAYKSKLTSNAEIQIYSQNGRQNFGRSIDSHSLNSKEKAFEIKGSELQKNDINNSLIDTQEAIDTDIPMPGIHMKIYSQNKIAENVNIGDPLKLLVYVEKQEFYGLHVTNCVVRDGLGLGEQKLINEYGCPTDDEIMGPFNYAGDKISASVVFPAHKFPYTTSVYYQCNVKLCDVKNSECFKVSECIDSKREKRQTFEKKEEDNIPAIIEVYSGLYVNENADIDTENDVVRQKANGENELCVSQKTFAISIAIAGLVLMLTIIAAVICIMSRRKTKTLSNSESSIYSGPYTNTAFSHSS
ncbi:uncharacterized protein LOC129614161 isoform X2 [Condylostylus longicornis]|uniref:uncharacterized protein LOC129614161 isoform X2 n=1 Tax=Condylostylus longicornis TaxID=2530218 RepID=UPI00244E2113|nr:uncharacterized protein LOC129614161 isoform X2 [Condylostylus longicornis]